MSNKLYKIKPLVWETPVKRKSDIHLGTANGPMMTYELYGAPDVGFWVTALGVDGLYRYSLIESEVPDRNWSTPEAAKAAADAHNAELMREGLEEVTNG